jgi:hypothetical protein
MPFKSEKQRRFLWAAHPELAKRWAHEYPDSNKGLPMYAKKTDEEKKAALFALERAILAFAPNTWAVNTTISNTYKTKAANSGMVKVDIQHSDKPTYSGEEREKGELNEEGNPKCDGKPAGTGDEAISAIFGKLSAVLARPFREAMEARKAQEEAREPRFVPENLGVRRYSIPSPGIAPPMGMTAPTVANPTPQPVQQPGQPSINSANGSGPVGGGSNPQHNPIRAFGPLGAAGQLNGNAALGVKNSPDSLKAAAIKAALSGNKLPPWYGAEGLIEGQDGHYRYGVHHAVGIHDRAPGFLSRLLSKSPYVLRDDVPKYKKRLKQIRGLQVYEDPDELHFSHSGRLRPETRQLIEAALAKHASLEKISFKPLAAHYGKKLLGGFDKRAELLPSPSILGAA